MHQFFHSDYLYTLVETQRSFIEPYRFVAQLQKEWFKTISSRAPLTRSFSAVAELFERVTRNYPKPAFNITETQVNARKVAIMEEVAVEKTFCRLLHFRKEHVGVNQPKMLIVAPLSGHYATLLRGTVEGMLPFFDVYVTDWVNVRDVSVEEGSFHFSDFVNYSLEFIRYLGEGVHVMAVCQPAVPVFSAVALMAVMAAARDETSLAVALAIWARLSARCVSGVEGMGVSCGVVGWLSQSVMVAARSWGMRPPGFLMMSRMSAGLTPMAWAAWRWLI